MDYECRTKAFYTTAMDDRFRLSVKEISESYYYSFMAGGELANEIYFCETDVYCFKTRSDTDLEMLNFDELEIDGYTYKSVTQVNDLSGKRRITSFIKVAYFGIIQFYDSESELTWTQLRGIKD